MQEKAIIVGLNREMDVHSYEQSMEELKNLCEACNLEVIGSLVQKNSNVSKRFYIGTGKIEELVELENKLEATVIVFNQELAPSQIRNIEKKVQGKVLDKTALILHIFSERAQSREAKLQVEVARLQYELPRLVGANEYLGRQSGGVGTKNKGSGEQKLELDRRRIEARITMLQRELEGLKIQSSTRSSQREKSQVPRVALVGYTNAGKSSVLNALLTKAGQGDEKKVLQKDMLFATLETSTRQMKIDGYRQFLLSDTVGFVSDLPHALVKAFRSTLKEVQEADLLLHIVDYSNANYKDQIKVTEETLKEIGANQIPVIYVFNKIDQLGELTEVESSANECYISAKEVTGIIELLDEVSQRLYSGSKKCVLLLPYEDGEELPYLMEHTRVLRMTHEELGYKIEIECGEKDYKKYKKYMYLNNDSEDVGKI